VVAAAATAAAKSLQSCPTLCDPIDGSPPGSPVPGILQARTLERVAISSPTPQFKSIHSSVLSFLHSPTLTSIHDIKAKSKTFSSSSRARDNILRYIL